VLDEPRGGGFEVVANDSLGRRGFAALDGRKQCGVLLGELADSGVSLHELCQAQQDLAPERLVSMNETGVSGADHEGAVEREIGFDDHPLGAAGSQPVVAGKRTARGIGDGSAGSQRPCRLDFDRGAQLIDLTEILRGQGANEDPAIARLGHQSAADEPVESGAKRVPTDLELLGEADLAEMLTGAKAPVEHLSRERFLERLDPGCRLTATHRSKTLEGCVAAARVRLRVRDGAHPAHVAHAFASAECVAGGNRLVARATRAAGLQAVEGS
jgi:hypothetical protein